jgi:hypothetical protein
VACYEHLKASVLALREIFADGVEQRRKQIDVAVAAQA